LWIGFFNGCLFPFGRSSFLEGCACWGVYIVNPTRELVGSAKNDDRI
jgi:hypothetical protein